MRWKYDALPPPRAPEPHAPAAGRDAPPRFALPLDEGRYARRGWIAVVAGFLGFLLWAGFAPLDKGVPASGTVKVAGERKAVQSAADGTVARILVREGDAVAAGQPLLRLDETPARSEAESLRLQLAATQATAARLGAERDGRAAVAFEAGLLADPDARVQAALALQRQLFAARREALASEIGAMAEALAGYEAQLQGLRETQQALERQRAVLEEQVGGLRALAAQGFVARNRLLDTERMLAQTTGAYAENAGRVGLLQRQIAEQKLRIAQRRQQDQAELRGQLADARLQAEALAERLAAARYRLAHAVVSAPAAGRVVGLAVFTEGGYVRSGEKLMDVVPGGLPLMVEARLPVDLIDKVRPGLPVDLLFTAFNRNRTPHVPGEVEVVGADRLVEDKTGLPYYPVQVAVSAEGMRRLAGLDLRPGMPVEVFVRTGERSLLSYLFKPLVDRAHGALGEE